jgi:hypothetical protein
MPPGAGPDVSQTQLPAEISETANSYAVPRESAARESETARTTSTAAPAPKPARETTERTTTVASAATPRPKKTTATATPPKRARPATDVADAGGAMPPIPRGAVRAEYLGTTPDGNLVFGLPSSERGYVAPDSRRRRSRRPASADVLPAEPAILPAEPVGDDE